MSVTGYKALSELPELGNCGPNDILYIVHDNSSYYITAQNFSSFISGVAGQVVDIALVITGDYSIGGDLTVSGDIYCSNNVYGSNLVYKTGDQTIYGFKSFNEGLGINGSIEINNGFIGLLGKDGESIITEINDGLDLSITAPTRIYLNSEVQVNSTLANRVVLTDSSNQLISSVVNTGEMSYLSGATGNIQSQLNTIKTQSTVFSGQFQNFRRSITSGVMQQDITYPTPFVNSPSSIQCEFINDCNDVIYAHMINNISAYGFTVLWSDVIDYTGYYLSVIAKT